MHTHTHTQRGRAIEITAILIDALAHQFTSILLTLRESALARATVIDTLYALTTRAHARTHTRIVPSYISIAQASGFGSPNAHCAVVALSVVAD